MTAVQLSILILEYNFLVNSCCLHEFTTKSQTLFVHLSDKLTTCCISRRQTQFLTLTYQAGASKVRTLISHCLRLACNILQVILRLDDSSSNYKPCDELLKWIPALPFLSTVITRRTVASHVRIQCIHTVGLKSSNIGHPCHLATFSPEKNKEII